MLQNRGDLPPLYVNIERKSAISVQIIKKLFGYCKILEKNISVAQLIEYLPLFINKIFKPPTIKNLQIT